MSKGSVDQRGYKCNEVVVIKTFKGLAGNTLCQATLRLGFRSLGLRAPTHNPELSIGKATRKEPKRVPEGAAVPACLPPVLTGLICVIAIQGPKNIVT